MVENFKYNYNCRDYSADTIQINQSEGADLTGAMQLNNGTPTVNADGSLRISGTINGTIVGYNKELNISSNANLTLIIKVRDLVTSGDKTLIGNRGSSATYNYLLRTGQQYFYLHDRYYSGSQIEPKLYHPSNEYTLVIRMNNGVVTYSDWNETPIYQRGSNFSPYSTASAQYYFFSEVDGKNMNWSGDFYYAFCAHRYLSDEEVNEVIEFNEGKPKGNERIIMINGKEVLPDMLMNGTPRILTDYEIFDSVKFNGNTYFDTQFMPLTLDSFECDIEVAQNSDSTVFGERSGWTQTQTIVRKSLGFSIHHNSSGYGGDFTLGSCGGSATEQKYGKTIFSMSGATTNRFKCVANHKGITITQDGKKWFFERNSTTFNGAACDLWVGWCNQLGVGQDNKLTHTIHYLKFYEKEGELTHHYVGAKRYSDNSIGLYDIVKDQFFQPISTSLDGFNLNPPYERRTEALPMLTVFKGLEHMWGNVSRKPMVFTYDNISDELWNANTEIITVEDYFLFKPIDDNQTNDRWFGSTSDGLLSGMTISQSEKSDISKYVWHLEETDTKDVWYISNELGWYFKYTSRVNANMQMTKNKSEAVKVKIGFFYWNTNDGTMWAFQEQQTTNKYGLNNLNAVHYKANWWIRQNVFTQTQVDSYGGWYLRKLK